MKNKQKTVQYICNLIMEYWEEKQKIPAEPKKIILAWLGYIETDTEQNIEYIIENIERFFEYEFFTVSTFKTFVYNEIYNSVEFKIMCDRLRDKNNG